MRSSKRLCFTQKVFSLVIKEHWYLPRAMSGGHCLSGCYRQHHKEREGVSSFLCVWAGHQESSKKLLSLTGCNLLNLWPHHSLRIIFPWGFSDRCCKAVWRKRMRPPIMLLCDGSMVLMQAICLSFAKTNLQDTINHYYNIACGKGTKEDFEVPILHRCLSHDMKNAKDMCRK